MKNSKGFGAILIPSATVFISSACIMIIELVAGRLIARHLGSSLYTWTSIIGVVLAGITIGNYLGGRIADRFKPAKTLSILFGLASVACITIIILNNVVGNWIWLWELSWPTRVFLHITMVFLLPSTILGTISPVVAKMALDKGFATGRTVGDIYAWGAAGSIAGTFLAGFFLIAAMGTIAIVWSVAAILIFIGILYRPKFIPLYIWAIVLAVLALISYSSKDSLHDLAVSLKLDKPNDSAVLYEDETPYCYVAVRRLSDNPDTREFVQDKLRHSHIVMNDITKLQYFYTNIYAAYTKARAKGKKNLNMMVIGGGGYAFPQYLEKNYPNANVEVVEIDPGVTKAAYAAFGLSKNTKIKTITLDARNYVDQLLEESRKTGKKKLYDFIYEDAINDFSVPFQLVTREFNEKIKSILSDDGMYMINLIDSYDNGHFLGAIINTVKETFPYVHIATNKVSLPDLRDTYVVAASMKPFDAPEMFKEFNPELKFRNLGSKDLEYLKKQSDGIILTDNYAPVENLLAPVVKQSAKEILARKYLSTAKKYKSENKLDKAIKYYKMAANLNKSMTTLCYNEIGTIEARRNKIPEAIDAFKYAVKLHDTTKNAQDIIGALCMNLGILYEKSGDSKNATYYLKKAITEFNKELAEDKDSYILMNRIGITYSMLGDFDNAAVFYTKALRSSKGNPEYFDNLISAYEKGKRFDMAIATAKQLLRMQQAFGRTKDAQLTQKRIKYLEYQKNNQ